MRVFGRSERRKGAWFRSLQNFVDVDSGSPSHVVEVAVMAHEADFWDYVCHTLEADNVRHIEIILHALAPAVAVSPPAIQHLEDRQRIPSG